MKTPESIQTLLGSVVAEREPGRLLLIGATDADASRITACAPDECNVVRLSADDSATSALANDVRFDLAVVIHTLERLSPEAGKRLLGRLRNVLAQSIVAGVRARSDDTDDHTTWCISDFIAMGFRQCRTSAQLAGGWSVYRYDIHDYKTTPDWLSSRYWANPKRWDKERW
ncbi:hypothetical protein J7355_15960 [Endozoicomonas sp. G2_2]|nr:hypothetical protein [Endozoicomonas sp. G2_2]